LEANPVSIVVCVDVEPDLDRFVIKTDRIARAKANTWDSFQASADFFESLRTTLPLEAKPAFSWFIRADPQIAFDFGSADYGFTWFKGYIDRWVGHGDEIGLHVHAWRHDPVTNAWTEDRTNQEWVSNCVRVGFEAYKQQMGRVPSSFRFGNRWMNTPTMNLLRQLGAEIDMTVEPGYDASPWTPYLKGLSDWDTAPRGPYLPSIGDYTRATEKGSERFVELPLTTVAITATTKMHKMLGTIGAMIAGRRNLSQVPHGSVLRELMWYIRLRYGRLDLLLSSQQFRKAARSVLHQLDHPFFGLILRSDDCLDESALVTIRRNLESLIEEIRRSGRSPAITTPTRAREILGCN
jgi:hypothetical protein